MRSQFCAGALVLLAIPSALDAQALRVESQASCVFSDLRVATSTRGLAMGDANTVGRDDDVIFSNPGRLAIARGTSVAGERYDVGLVSGTFATVSRIGGGSVGVGVHVTAAHQQPYCPLTPSDPQPDTPVSLALGSIGFAQTLKRFQLGAAMKYVVEETTVRSSRLVADVGVARDMSFGSVPISVGLAAQNLSANLDNRLMPWRVALGAAAGGPLGPFDLALAAQAASTRHDVDVGGGLEIGYQWLDGYSIALRTGIRRGSPDDERAFTGGAGLQIDRVSVEYAFETQLYDRPLAHRIGLRIR
jgi:hypothetical protein